MGALDALKAGGVALVATDTVYGLAALPGSEGYSQIFALKQRPQDQVLPWLVGGIDALDTYGARVPEYARKLAVAFWPGALTLVVNASDEAVALGGVASDGTIALRMPDEQDTLNVIAALGSPVACTSANLHGKPAVSKLSDLDPAFDSIPRDSALSPQCKGESASAIVDCTSELPKLLRDGHIGEQVLLAVALLDDKLI